MKKTVWLCILILCVLLIPSNGITNNYAYAYGETIVEDGWSNWSDSQVYSEFGTQERTLYRTSKKLEKISDTNSNENGWYCEEIIDTWSGWTNWSKWLGKNYYLTAFGSGVYFNGTRVGADGRKYEMQVSNNQWRARYQNPIRKYRLCKWDDWSDWTDKAATATDKLKVETKKQYRGKLFGSSIYNVSADLTEYSTASISWAGIPGAESYYLYMRKANGWGTYDSWEQIGTYEDGPVEIFLNEAGDYEFCVRPYRYYNGVAYLGSSTKNSGYFHAFGYAEKPRVELKGQDTLGLYWNTTAGANEYDVYYKSRNKTNWKIVQLQGNNSCSLTIKGAEGKYDFKIKPKYNNGTQVSDYPGFSDTCTFTFMTKNKLRATKNNKISVKLTWNKGQGKKDGYEIYRSIKSKGKYKKIKTISANAGTKVIIVQKARGKSYYYKIRPYRMVEGKKVYGPYSNIKAIRL